MGSIAVRHVTATTDPISLRYAMILVKLVIAM